MTKKTIMSVNTDPTIWDKGKFGPLAFIEVTFADGDMGSVACKPENADRVIGILEGLERKEFDFELEAKDDYNGIPQWKIKDYPGKPGVQQDGGGGNPQRSGGGGGGYRGKSPEEQHSIQRQTSLKSAAWVAAAANVTDAAPVIAMAEEFYAWLTATEKSGSAVDRPSGGPLPSSDPDEAEGGVPASPSGPATAKQKAKLNMLYESSGKLMIAAKAMFPDVSKIGDVTEDMAAALIEDKESA